jgi:hypothetical protein
VPPSFAISSTRKTVQHSEQAPQLRRGFSRIEIGIHRNFPRATL